MVLGWRGPAVPRQPRTVEAGFLLTALPEGGALVLRPEASACELEAPVRASGVVGRPGKERYARGSATTLRSADGAVAVAVPAGLSDRGLELTHAPQSAIAQ